MEGGFAQQLASLQRAASRATVNQSDQQGGGGKGGGQRGDERDGNGHRQQDHDHRAAYYGSSTGGYSRKRGRDDSTKSNNKNQFRTLIEHVAEQYKKDSPAIRDDEDSSNHNTNSKLLQPLQYQQRHVALLFLTIDDLPHEHIWRMWLQSQFTTTTAYDDNDGRINENNASSQQQEQQHPLRVSILVHAKFPERIKSAWLKRHHLLRRMPSPQQQQQQGMQHQHLNDNTNSNNNNNNNTTNRFNTVNNLGSSQPPPIAAFHTRRPEWGSIEITRAMIDLLQAGLQIGVAGGGSDSQNGCDNDNDVIFVNENNTDDINNSNNSSITPVDRFIFVSESCLPVVTLTELEMALFGPRGDDKNCGTDDSSSSSSTAATRSTLIRTYDKSWINAMSTPNNGYALQYQWNAILAANKNNNTNHDASNIPNNHIWKADQWVMLTRAHASAIISLPNKYLGGRQLYHEFRKCRASDEMYIPTALSILGILHRPCGIREVVGGTNDARMSESWAGECILRRRMTYADWSVSAKNPASFTRREWKEVVDKARTEGCLFARKFVQSSPFLSSVRDGKEWRRNGGDWSKRNTNDNDYNDGLISVELWRYAVVGMNP